MTDNSILPKNAIPFIGLSTEYCRELESTGQNTREEFIDKMVRLLPRLYIMATDIKIDPLVDDDSYIDNALDEEHYDAVRSAIAQVMGEDDIYLEVFEEDMKYSDTPVSASISEGLADIFQVLFNFLATVADATDSTIEIAMLSVSEDFKNYWSATLCNTLRALNALAYRAD